VDELFTQLQFETPTVNFSLLDCLSTKWQIAAPSPALTDKKVSLFMVPEIASCPGNSRMQTNSPNGFALGESIKASSRSQ
jgi:hypothetical protein